MIVTYIVLGVLGLLAIVAALSSIFTVSQGTIKVITRFGKLKGFYLPGINFKIPFVDQVHTVLSTLQQSVDFNFQAITADKANVNFSAVFVYGILDTTEACLNKAVFTFNSVESFRLAMTRTVEAHVREFISTVDHKGVLGVRAQLVDKIKEDMKEIMASWGYVLYGVQINEITFDKLVTESMAKLVASENDKNAATNNAEVSYITVVREAEGAKEVARLNGEAIALFRKEVAKGMKDAAAELGGETAVIMFTMWTETLKHIAEKGKGNYMFMDGSADGMQNIMKSLLANMASMTQPQAANAK